MIAIAFSLRQMLAYSRMIVFLLSTILSLQHDAAADDWPSSIAQAIPKVEAGTTTRISVVIDGGDARHVLEVFMTLQSLLKSKSIYPGEILLVGGNSVEHLMRLYRAFYSTATKPENTLQAILLEMKRAGFSKLTLDTDSSIIDTATLVYSPTWIVQSGQETVIFEGHSDIRSFLTRSGELRNAE